jgi:tetratricopeptide (TPR) repeat protein
VAPSQLPVEGLNGWSGPLELVGPSFWGAVYRSQEDGTLHRLVPAERATLERRRAVREWTGQPGLAPIVAATQLPSGVGYLVRYGVRAERTMADLLDEPDPRIRLEGVARLLEAFAGWADALGDWWLPMPADVAFAADNAPCLLPMPDRWKPAVAELFEEPHRAWHLAPELIRGHPVVTAEAVDRDALGMLVFRCFFRLPPTDSGEILLQVATGAASELQHAASSLPFWMQRLPAAPKLRAAAGDLLVADPAGRCRVDLQRLADRLADLLPWTDPLRAVVRLRRSGRLADAYLVLHDALLTSESQELLLLGARLAGELGRPLEAVDLLERAVVAEPTREALEAQLQLLVAPSMVGPAARAAGGGGARHLDDLLWRDFHALAASDQQRYEVDVAEHLQRRGRFAEASRFIYPRLFDGSTWLWWKFDLNFAYVETLMALGQLKDAAELLREMKPGFQKVLDNRTMNERELGPYRQRLAALREDLRRQGVEP